MRVFSEKYIMLKIKKQILSMIIFQYELHYVDRIYIDKTVYKYIKMMVNINYNSFMTHIIQCNEYDKDKECEKETLHDRILSINQRINREYCEKTFNELSDTNLLPEYIRTKSVKKKIKDIRHILKKHNQNPDVIPSIINDITQLIIPPGTKGVIKGNKFNFIVKQKIIDMKLHHSRFEIQFEKHCLQYLTDEIPDWYIIDHYTKKIMIGMNQLDIWRGGHQLNRGTKYIHHEKFDNTTKKLMCVVCHKIEFKTAKNKAFTLFCKGFQNDTLCYINGLEQRIKSFFNI